MTKKIISYIISVAIIMVAVNQRIENGVAEWYLVFGTIFAMLYLSRDTIYYTQHYKHQKRLWSSKR